MLKQFYQVKRTMLSGAAKQPDTVLFITALVHAFR